MKSLVALLAASLLVFVLLVITSNGTDKSLRSPSRGLSEDRALVQSAMASSVQSMADSAVLFFRESSKSNGKKGKTGKKAKKGKKGKKAEKGKTGKKGKKGKKGKGKHVTPSVTPLKDGNVILSAAYLMPVSGKAITAHSTRARVLRLLEETRARRGDGERSMIVDVSATCWNWDTYAIVAGKPLPVAVVFSDEDEMRKRLPLEGGGKRTVGEGILLPQPSGKKVWMPKGAVLKESNKKEDGMTEFIFEAPVDPNDDRLEHWEQEVVGNRHLHEWRAKLVWNSMRSMMRFYNLDRIVCWDLSWGIWEAVRDGDEACDDGFPRMKFRMEGKEDVPFPPSVKWDAGAEAEEARETIYSCCRPVGPGLLSETLTGVSGYYLVGGNTYTMSLFHNMWDREGLEKGGGAHAALEGPGEMEEEEEERSDDDNDVETLGRLYDLKH